ncbi:formamidopyrimidine-DNA glycosylase-like [Miscanthus floridulus]|uniref:formamidopyrimidine-DNA glycosylase-like n=1 Tax=Miscanthus floridulus TaxID=154761 RepID=UPI00345ABBE9
MTYNFMILTYIWIVILKYLTSDPSKLMSYVVMMDDGLEFSFTVKRRFAKIRLLDNPEAAPPISELGPDAVFEPIKLDKFMKSLGQKKGPIKALLLDQSFKSGIGNWMADEVLYQARIHPGQTASKISKDKCEIFHQCIKEVIEESLKVGAGSNQFPEKWIFHSREKKPGKKIDFITIGGRTSAYAQELQKLDGTDAAASRSKGGKDKEKSNKATNTSDDGDEEDYEVEEAKPAKRGRKQPTRVANTSSKNAGSIHGDEATDEEDARPAKRGKKQIEKTTKRSLKEANHEDSDEEAVGKIEAKPGKAPTEARSLPKQVDDAGPARRPQRKLRQP